MRIVYSSGFPRMMGFVSVFLVAFFLALGTSSAQDSTRLDISVENGQVRLEPKGADFSREELDALQKSIQGKLSRTPFSSGGEIKVTLKEDTVVELKRELARTNLGDQREVDRALNEVWDRFDEMEEGGTSNDESAKVLIGQTFAVDPGESHESVVSIGSTGRIDGRVDNLVLIGSDVEVGDAAEVGESLVIIGSQARISSAARIRAEEVRVALPSSPGQWISSWTASQTAPEITWVAIVWWFVGTLIASIALGLLYLWVLPRFARRTADDLMANKGSSFGIGFLGYLALAPAIVVLVLSLVGILVIPVFVIAFAFCVLAGYFTASLAVGRMVRANRAGGPEYWQFVIGVVILKVIGLVPFLGGFLVALATTTGFGAVLRSMYVAFKNRRRAPTRTEPLPPTSGMAPA